MTDRQPSRPRAGRASLLQVAGVVAATAVTAVLGSRFISSPPAMGFTPSASWASSAAPETPVFRNDGASHQGAPASSAPDGELALAPATRLGKADGRLPSGTNAFDVAFPGIGNLDSRLLAALRRATSAAAGRNVEILVSSGWRSLAYQTQLFEQAIATYGSPAKAAVWVAPPGTSAHEAGAAVDIGQSGAVAWLSAHGASYGLCQIYRNEPWHYELRPAAIDQGCPPMYADATQGPGTDQ